MSDEEPVDKKDLTPLYKVEEEQVDVGMTPQFPTMSIVHIQTHNKTQDILALGFETAAAKKLYIALGVCLQLQQEFGTPEEAFETPTEEIPKNKIN
jgi:hypothetical protein